MAFSRLVSSKLKGILDDFVEIDDDAFACALSSGDLHLRHVRVKPKAVDSTQSAVRLLSGVVDELHIRLPWAKLASEPIVVEIVGLRLTVQPSGDDSTGFRSLETSGKFQ